MDIRNLYIKEKSEIQKTKEQVTNNIMKQQGMYDMYFLGHINIIESLVNYIDKEIIIALLKGLAKSEDTSETIKKLASDLIEKYSKEPKFEL